MQYLRALVKKILITYLSCYLIFAPLAVSGAPLTPDGSTQTTIDSARNGVPVVNVANPSASGLSHNKFTDYNVNAQGLILNNANTSTVNTQLGGYIFGNPNLSNNASVILNEVTSTNRSSLNGFTEVAGPGADLVIANPNGLTINGAGFINTSNVTLTTGTPGVAGGALNSLNVTGGDIAIQGAGLNTQSQTSTNIYTHYLNLNAKIHANALDLKLGKNQINYVNKAITGSTNSGNTTGLLLDASALGGMYANRIALVGTDAGLGVNLPPEVLASTGDISINNDGTIALQKVSAGGNVGVNSASAVTLAGNLYSGANATVTAGSNLSVNAGVVAGAKTGMTINANQLTNQGTIVAGLNKNGTLNNTGALAVTTTAVTNSGQIQSGGSINVQTTTLNNSNGKIDAAQNLVLASKSANLNNSILYAGSDATVTLDRLDNVTSSSMGAGRNMTINAVNGITNSADLLANGSMTLSTNAGVVNNKIISSGGVMLVNANTLDNRATGTISGGTGISKLSIAGNINNQSRISGSGSLEVSGADIINTGFFSAGSDLTIRSNNLTNNSTLFAGNNMNLYTMAVLSNNPTANIFAMNNLVMAADITNAKTGTITNDRGHIEAYQGSMGVYTSNLINRTNPPIVQGTYVARVAAVPAVPSRIVPAHWQPATANTRARFVKASRTPAIPAKPAVPAYIVGGTRLSTASTTTGCGFNCKNVVTTSVDAMKLTSSSAPATINAGSNMTLNATNINNQYSLISAGGNIHLASQVVDNQPVDILQVKTTSTAMYRNQTYCKGFNIFGCWGGYGNRMVYAGTSVSSIPSVNSSVSSTIQAGANITGSAANLTNGNIRKNQVIALSTAQTQNTSTTANTKASSGIQLPAGSLGLFVVSQNPQSQFLIETNPQFTSLGNFLSSNYLLNKLNVTATLNMKRVGDAFYENKLIRDSIFAQTGRRFLKSDLTSDNAQYQYLMDSALQAQQELKLVPGIALTSSQVAMLNRDIVWLEEQTVAGQKVLVPVVYIANIADYRVEGGKIIAGNDLDLTVAELKNSGLLEAGNSLAVDASQTISNQGGSIRAGENVSLIAQNDIENISANIKAKNIILASADGTIINKRFTKDQLFAGAGYRDATTQIGQAGNIEATENLTLNAGKTIAVTGSKLKGKNVALNAEQVDIRVTVDKSDYSGGSSGFNIKEQSTTHIGSEIEGENIAINSSGRTTVEGSRVTAKENLNVEAGELNVLAVNDSRYSETKSTNNGFLSKRSDSSKKATSTNIASNLSGGNVSLSTVNDSESSDEGGAINIIGSNVAAKGQLALNSAGDINVQAGYDGSLSETHTKKSGWFTGGALFSKSEDLEGKLNKTAALSNLSGGDVSLNAKEDIALKGVNVSAEKSLTGTAENITVENVNDEEKTYSKHEKLTVGLGDIAQTVLNPLSAINVKDGKASVTIAKADFSNAEQVTTKTTVVSSNLEAGNINLTARDNDSDQDANKESDKVNAEGREGALGHEGNILIKGSNLVADGEINLTAENDVNITEAKDTEKTTSKDQKGKAELKVTVKNEYVQIGYAVKAAKEAKDNLQKAKSSYSQYKRDLGVQRGKLLKLKADLANGKIGIEQADIDEFEGLIDDLKGDDAFYKANIALAASDLVTKTLAVQKQMATALQTGETMGFSASLELDIDLLEEKFEAYKERSVASNLVATDINIKSGETTTVRGSNLQARDTINVDSKDLNVVASQDVNSSSNSSEHKNLNLSMGTSGAMSASASLDSSKGSSRGLTNSNSQLSASNININTGDHTKIAGANVAAGDTLNLNSGSLEVASVQDSQRSNSKSQGFTISGGSDGISGAGIRKGNSRSSQKETVLTTVTGGNVNIDVKKDTTLKGATIAAVDNEGNDSGNLNLTSKTLEVSSLNNRRDSKSMSLDVGVGQTVSLDYANDRSNSKTKTLGTLGEGNINVANVDDSNTRMLNRDINDNEVDIYNVESHKGLKGSLDTRLLTKNGLNDIAEDFERSKRGAQAIADVATKDAFELQDTFAHIDETQKDLDVQKAFALANDGKNIEALQGDGSTIEEKQAAIKLYAQLYAETYGIDIETANVIATSKVIGGTHYGKDGTSSIDINDNAQRNATDYANTMGHEVAHARISQDKVRDRKSEKLNEEYANTMGEYSADGMEFSSGTYNNVSLDQNKVTNDHTQTASDKELLTKNNKDWRENVQRARNGDGEIDYRLTPHQEAEKEKELAQSDGPLSRAVIEIKYDAISTKQGAAEAAGMLYGGVEQAMTDVVALAAVVEEIYNDPAKAEALAESLDADLNRLQEVINGSDITPQEKAEAEKMVQGIAQNVGSFVEDVSVLDGEGVGASANEGKKTGAAIVAAVGLGKLSKFLKGKAHKPEVDGPNDPVHDIQSGADVNKSGAERYGDRYRPEHVPDKSVVLTDFPKDREMVHVFNVDPRKSVDSQKVGDWAMPKSEITRPDGTMMSPAEIQQKFSLPETPTHIVDVKPDKHVRTTVSTVAGKLPENGGAGNHFGDGGGQQWRIQEDLTKSKQYEEWFQNPRPLEDVQ